MINHEFISFSIVQLYDLSHIHLHLPTLLMTCICTHKMLLCSQNPAAHMNLGAMLHLQEKLDEAEKSYMKALRLRPGDQLTEENLRKLRSLQARKKV